MNAFKDVMGMDQTSTFDAIEFEIMQEEGAALEVASGLDSCKKRQTATEEDCMREAMDEFHKLTGKTIESADLKRMKEQADEQAVGALGDSCTQDVLAAHSTCIAAASDQTATDSCNSARDAGYIACSSQIEDFMAEKKYGKTVSQMSNIEKAMMEADKVKAAGKTAVDKGRSCRIAAGTNSAKLAACANEEMNAFFSAKGENYDSLDSMEKVKLETEFMIAKETQAELASAKNMRLCMEAIPASDSLSTKKTKMASCENKAKAEYEAATGITIDAAEYQRKKVDAAAKDLNANMRACNDEAFTLAGAARDEKIALCQDLAKEKLRQNLGLFEEDISADASAELAFELKYQEMVEEQTRRQVSEAIKSAGAGLAKADRKLAAKAAMISSLGKENITDVEVEKFIAEGAITEVQTVMDTCRQSIDDSLSGAALKTAVTACETKAKEAFKSARMLEGIDTLVIETEFKTTQLAAAKKGGRDAIKAKLAHDSDATDSELRVAAKDALTATMALDSLDDVEFEANLIEMAQQEGVAKMEACFEMAMAKPNELEKKAQLANCHSEAKAAANDVRLGSADIDDKKFVKMIHDAAQEKAAKAMAAAYRAKPDMTPREKLDAVKIEMKKTLATSNEIDDVTVQEFLHQGTVRLVRDLAKNLGSAAADDARQTIQNAMKESLGRSDVTLVDAERFLETAAIDEVDNVKTACIESGKSKSQCETSSKAAFKTLLFADVDSESDAVLKELKLRELDYEYERAKEAAAQKRALNDMRAKIEDAMSKNIDINTPAFKNEKRSMAKNAFVENLGVDDISEVELESLLQETAKKEGAAKMEACFSIATAEGTSKTLEDCRADAMIAAQSARMAKPGSAAETFAEEEFNKMMNEAAKVKAAETMQAVMRAQSSLTEREKLDTIKAEMRKTLATEEAIDDYKVKAFLNDGAVSKVRDITKNIGSATHMETRKSIQEAMKEALGKPDKVINGNNVPQVTEVDAEVFIVKASIEEVASVLTACKEAGESQSNCTGKAEAALAKILPKGDQLTSKRLIMKLESFRRQAVKKEMKSLAEACGANNCAETMKSKVKSLLGGDNVDDTTVQEYVLKGSEEAAQSYMQNCMEDASKDFSSCRDGEVKKAVLRSRGLADDAALERANLQETLKRSTQDFVQNRIAACRVIAGDNEAQAELCSSLSQIKEEMQKMTSRTELVDVVAIQRETRRNAVQIAALSTKDLNQTDKIAEMRKAVEEETGVNLEELKNNGQPMLEHTLLKEGRQKRLQRLPVLVQVQARLENRVCSMKSLKVCLWRVTLA